MTIRTKGPLLQLASLFLMLPTLLLSFLFWFIMREFVKDLKRLEDKVTDFIGKWLFALAKWLLGGKYMSGWFANFVQLALIQFILLLIFIPFFCYILSVTTRLYEFYKLQAKNRTKVRSEMVMGTLDPTAPVTPATPMQPELRDPKKAFYGVPSSTPRGQSEHSLLMLDPSSDYV